MQILKKEWKAILFIIWLIGITVFMYQMNGSIQQLQQQNNKVASTLDSVESIVITTDRGLADTGKKVDEIGSNVSFIVQKVRRR